MRTMMRVTIPAEHGNKAVKEGTMGKIVGQFMEQHRPEAAYFTANAGSRCAYFFLDLKDSSEMVGLAEPFYMGLHAHVEFQPAMNPQDLKAGLEKLKL